MRKNKLLVGDNLDSLSFLSNKKEFFDFIIIDPPYNSDIDRLNYKDSFKEIDYYFFIRNRVEKVKELMSNDSVCMIQIDEHGFKTINEIAEELFEGSFQIFIWDKLGPEYSSENDHKLKDRSKKVIRVSHEYIFICFKNNKKQSQKEIPWLSDVFKTIYSENNATNAFAKKEIKHLNEDKFVTPKPTKLIQDFIEVFRTKKEMKILDLFGGSGSSVGFKSNDLVTLCEINQENINLIKRREPNIEIETIATQQIAICEAKKYYSKYKNFEKEFAGNPDKISLFNSLIVTSLFMRHVVIPFHTKNKAANNKRFDFYNNIRNRYIHEYFDMSTFKKILDIKEDCFINKNDVKTFISSFKLKNTNLSRDFKVFVYAVKLCPYFLGDFNLGDFI